MNLHVDHELFESRSDRGIEALYCLNSRCQHEPLRRRREKKAILPHASTNSICVLLQYEVERGDQRKDVVSSGARMAFHIPENNVNIKREAGITSSTHLFNWRGSNSLSNLIEIM